MLKLKQVHICYPDRLIPQIQLWMMLQSAGASLFDEDGKPAMTDNAALKECIDIYKTMVDEGIYLRSKQLG